MTSRPRYSFVVPVHNEEETLAELHGRLSTVLERLDGDAELIFVDDGSTDRSFDVLRELRARDDRVRIIRLARNFGHQIAITAGIDVAAGDAVVIMDADLQDPPEVVPELISKWREGYEVVYAIREDRAVDPLPRRLAIRAFYRILRRLSDVEIPVDVGDFRLVDRRPLDEFKAMRERNRYVRGMFAWIGFRQTGVPYRRDPRFAGSSKYPFRRMVRLALDGVVSFSNAPLRLALTVGFIVSGTAFLTGVAAIVAKVAHLYAGVPGWASVVVIMSFLGGVQLIVLGTMGLYVARIYDEARSRPLYVVRDAYGFAAPPAREQLDLGPARVDA